VASTTRIAGLILAGGKGERLGGVNKALTEVGGVRLIDRAVAALADCDTLLVSVGARRIEGTTLEQVLDLVSTYAGPLAGVAAGIDALWASPPDLLLTMAVDTPFFPSDFLARARPLLASAEAVVATYGGQLYPTNAVWRFDAVRALPERVRDGTAPHSLKRLAVDLNAAHLDYAPLVADDPFLNANTPADLENLRARIGQKPTG
jgi:molybdenum cofactor guanylyltransferase